MHKVMLTSRPALPDMPVHRFPGTVTPDESSDIAVVRIARRHAALMTGSRRTGDLCVERALRTLTRPLLIPRTLMALYDRLTDAVPTGADSAGFARLQDVSFRARAVFVLRSIQGLSLGDTAEILHLPPESVPALQAEAHAILGLGTRPAADDAAAPSLS